jgi:hypothetical protein
MLSHGSRSIWSRSLLVFALTACEGGPSPDGGRVDGGEVDGRGIGVDAPAGPSTLRVSPERVSLRPLASAHFDATLDGVEAAVAWSVRDAEGGTIDAAGDYVAPATEGTYHVVATLTADVTQRAEATISVVAAGGCGSLPAAGVWENITPVGTAAEAVNGTVGAAIVVDPFEPSRVWLGTGGENDEIWRSDDCGASWNRVNTGPGSVGDGMTFGGVGDGAQWSMMVDPVEPNVLYAVSGYGAQSLWKSTDGGVSWTDVLLGTDYDAHADYRFVNNVSLDPADHLHLVVATHGACSAPYAPNCMAETHDGGATWRTFVAPRAWEEGGGIVVVSGDTWLWCGGAALVTRDAGATWSDSNLAGGGGCEAEYTIRPLVPAANGRYYVGSRDGVIRSDDGWSWEHVPGTSGIMVMVVASSTHVFAANQWGPSIRWASLDDDERWSELPTPPQLADGHDGGIPFLAFDDVHHVLYASMFSGGVARMVVAE